MGIAAYNRGSKGISRFYDDIQAAKDLTNTARARLWLSLLARGAILTFRGNDGSVITAGPHQTATGVPPHFSLYREGGGLKYRGAWFESVWAIALRIIENVGRRAPVRIALT